MTVFISYAREDEAYARELSLALIEVNVKVWRDQYRLRAGDMLEEALLAAIRASRLFVVLVSEASAKSNWVAIETAYAIERETQELIEIVPVRLDKGSVLPALAGRIYVDGKHAPSWVASQLVQRALDAASPATAGGHVSDDARCYTHFGQEAGLDDEGRLWAQLDIVSFDLDSPYSILSQFHFISADPVEGVTKEEAAAVAGDLIKACAANARAEPWRVKLRRNEVAKGSFTIDCGWAQFKATYRIGRIGKVDRGVVVFNAGALFDLTSGGETERSSSDNQDR